MAYNASFDEANYYQGNKFQLGGNDRTTSLDLSLIETRRAAWGGRSDDKIYEDAWRALIRNHKIDLGGIDISVTNGTLKLTGRVSQFSEKQEAEKTLFLVPGIVDIVNDLSIGRVQG